MSIVMIHYDSLLISEGHALTRKSNRHWVAGFEIGPGNFWNSKKWLSEIICGAFELLLSNHFSPEIVPNF